MNNQPKDRRERDVMVLAELRHNLIQARKMVAGDPRMHALLTRALDQHEQLAAARLSSAVKAVRN
jgi:hypothetical protein